MRNKDSVSSGKIQRKVLALKKENPNRSATQILSLLRLPPSKLLFVKKVLNERIKKVSPVLSPADVKKIWKLHKTGLGYRRITRELGLPMEKRGSVEGVIRGRSWTKKMPNSIRPHGVVINVRERTVLVYDAEKPDFVIELSRGFARVQDRSDIPPIKIKAEKHLTVAACIEMLNRFSMIVARLR